MSAATSWRLLRGLGFFCFCGLPRGFLLLLEFGFFRCFFLICFCFSLLGSRFFGGFFALGVDSRGFFAVLRRDLGMPEARGRAPTTADADEPSGREEAGERYLQCPATAHWITCGPTSLPEAEPREFSRAIPGASTLKTLA